LTLCHQALSYSGAVTRALIPREARVHTASILMKDGVS
jgi:hypothetical protein